MLTNLIDGLKIFRVNQITSGAAISKPVIRGLGYRVITLVDGILSKKVNNGGANTE